MSTQRAHGEPLPRLRYNHNAQERGRHKEIGLALHASRLTGTNKEKYLRGTRSKPYENPKKKKEAT